MDMEYPGQFNLPGATEMAYPRQHVRQVVFYDADDNKVGRVSTLPNQPRHVPENAATFEVSD